MREIHGIQDIHTILFDSLCYFDRFCREHNLRYFLANGTLLGAAKYGDFVPWDDDVDILLPREDYDRLVQLTEINNGSYRLLCREQVPSWRLPYAKLSREDTLIQEGDYDFGVSFGLSVDIFPIDAWSPCLPIAKLQAFRCEVLKRLLICSNGGAFQTEKTGIRRLILKSIWLVGKGLGYQRVLNKITRTVERSKRRKKKYLGCVCWTCHLDNEIFPAEFFETAESLTFCGKPFPVFKNYERYLERLYGKWREDLPPEKQHSNHNVKVWWKDDA